MTCSGIMGVAIVLYIIFGSYYFTNEEVYYED